MEPSFEKAAFSGRQEVGDGWYVLGRSDDFTVTFEDDSTAEPLEGNPVLQVVVPPRA